MIKQWQPMADYQYFLNNSKATFDSSERMRLRSELWLPFQKLKLLDTDKAMAFLMPFYSTTGRPATNQPQILRSFVLFFLLHSMGLTPPSLTFWVERLRHDRVLATLSAEELLAAPRHFSDPDASWGWDSDLDRHFFGYSLFHLACHNNKLHADIPLLLRFTIARRHDSVSFLVAFRELEEHMPDLPIENMCLDSAMDNLPTYNLLKQRKIRAFIDLNSKRSRPKTIPDTINIDNRILNDYGLHRFGIHRREHYSFLTTIIGICIHLDARYKQSTMETS